MEPSGAWSRWTCAEQVVTTWASHFLWQEYLQVRQAIPGPSMACLHTPQTLCFLKSFFLKLCGHVVNSSGWKRRE